MGAKKRQRTAAYHMEQMRFEAAEDAMNASEAKNFDKLRQTGMVREESNEGIQGVLQSVQEGVH